MATEIYALNPEDPAYNIRKNVGPTGTSAAIALVVDLGVSITDGSGTRAVSKADVLRSLELLAEFIVRDNSWPPA
jgi:hypothetical protein